MKLLTREDLKARGIPFTNKHLIELERTDRFPRRVRLGANTVAWIADEVDAFIANLANTRNVAPS